MPLSPRDLKSNNKRDNTEFHSPDSYRGSQSFTEFFQSPE